MRCRFQIADQFFHISSRPYDGRGEFLHDPGAVVAHHLEGDLAWALALGRDLAGDADAQVAQALERLQEPGALLLGAFHPEKTGEVAGQA